MPRSKKQMLRVNRDAWDAIAAKGHGRTSLPRYGPLAQREEELQLLGDVSGKRVLEIGCGTGHTLLYLAERGAGELWGLDISPAQIATARATLSARGVEATLFESPMEEDPGLPAAHFDLVVSIFSLGWAVDLKRAVALVASYLKPGGTLLFSWEHPVFNALGSASAPVSFARPYSYEGPIHGKRWADMPLVMHARMISTYVNGLVDAGLVIRRMVETEYRAEQDAVHYSHRWFSPEKASVVPTTMILLAAKPA